MAKLTKIDRLRREDLFVIFANQCNDYRGITVPNMTESLINLGFQHVDPDAETAEVEETETQAVNFVEAFQSLAFRNALSQHILSAFSTVNGEPAIANGFDPENGNFTFDPTGELVLIPQDNGPMPDITLSEFVVEFTHVVAGSDNYDFRVVTDIGFPFTVDWGDGSPVEEFQAGIIASHTYAAVYDGPIIFRSDTKDTLVSIDDLATG